MGNVKVVSSIPERPWYESPWFKNMTEPFQALLLEHPSLGKYIDDLHRSKAKADNLALQQYSKARGLNKLSAEALALKYGIEVTPNKRLPEIEMQGGKLVHENTFSQLVDGDK